MFVAFLRNSFIVYYTTNMFGSSLANSNIRAVNAYGWSVQFKKGSLKI